jgi:hypothetical protein
MEASRSSMLLVLVTVLQFGKPLVDIIWVIREVTGYLKGENSKFWHNSASNV